MGMRMGMRKGILRRMRLAAIAGHASSKQTMPGLSSQAFTALGATCVEHGTAATGCHTGAEAVRALAADDGRLVSTFHCGLANQQKINRIVTPIALIT